jgi:hypothetical protein
MVIHRGTTNFHSCIFIFIWVDSICS